MNLQSNYNNREKQKLSNISLTHFWRVIRRTNWDLLCYCWIKSKIWTFWKSIGKECKLAAFYYSILCLRSIFFNISFTFHFVWCRRDRTPLAVAMMTTTLTCWLDSFVFLSSSSYSLTKNCIFVPRRRRQRHTATIKWQRWEPRQTKNKIK